MNELEAEDWSDRWRADLLTRFGSILVLGGAPVMAFVAATMTLPPVQLGACLLALGSGAASALARRQPYRARGVLLVVSLLFVGASLARQIGAGPGVVLPLALSTVLAAVVFGGRGGVLALAASGACLLAFGAAGHLDTAPRVAGELPRVQAWVRISAVYSLLTGLLVLLVASAVRRVERSLAETRACLGEAVRARRGRREAEEALRQNEERLRLALESARMGTWEWDISTGAVTWTGRVGTLAGLPPGTVQGTLDMFKETVHPEDRPALERTLVEALGSDASDYDMEYRVRGTDPVRWVEGKGRVYRDASGRAVLMRGTAADITARKRSEEALRRSEAELRALFASMEDLIFVLDAEGRHVRVAPTNPSLLFRPPGEVLGRRLHDVFDGEQAEVFLGYVRRCLETRRTVHFEYSLPIRGATTWFAATVSPMLHDCVVWVARDVTERRRAGQALREGEERWRRISEATSEGIAFTADGVITDVNAQLASMLGYSPRELIGKPVLDCVAPEHRSGVAEAIRSGHPGAYEHRALRKDGSTFPVDVCARSLTVQGRSVRVTAVRDLSERTRLEAELRRRDTLAAMGSLVAAVAHEVRTPLFSLSATVDTLEARMGSQSQQLELRALLRSQVRRLSNLMQDLLDYGRAPKLRLVPDQLRVPVRRAVESCLPAAARAGVEIACRVPDDLPEVLSDAGRLQQVFENLVANALQHSPRGSTVTVSAAAVDGAAAGLVCRVEDRGPGVPAEDLERVFEPFFSRRKGGTGMGLAVAQRFVEAHGGVLTAANRAGGGAAFTVFLPAVDGRPSKPIASAQCRPSTAGR